MLRFALLALLLLPACKSDPSSAAPSSAPASADSPHADSPHAGPGANPQANPHGDGPAAVPKQIEPRNLERLADGRVKLGPFSMLAPQGWTEKPSTSSMRVAEFQLPSVQGADAEVIVYYFGESGAGSVQANIDRWLSQFQQPDGKPSSDAAKVEKAQFAGQEATMVSVSGRYVAPAMPGGKAVDKPDQSLLAAIVNSARGPYYFRLIGGQAAVASHAAPFREMLASLKPQ